MSEYIIDIQGMPAKKIYEIINDKLHDPILQLLHEHGSLALEGMRYFLENRYDIHIDWKSLAMVMDSINNTQEIMKFWGDSEYIYAIPSDNMTPAIPVPADYATAYYTLYERYMLIRRNPGLAEMAEEYINALYRKQPAEAGDDFD